MKINRIAINTWTNYFWLTVLVLNKRSTYKVGLNRPNLWLIDRPFYFIGRPFYLIGRPFYLIGRPFTLLSQEKISLTFQNYFKTS
jgi:hypothetical protein